MNKIFVFGDKGQLGTDCRAVFADGFDVFGADLPEVNAGDRNQCFAALDAVRPDVIVNCAAFTAVDLCESERGLCREANTDAPQFMAEWAEANGAFLVHVSTDYVFSGDRPLYEASVETDAAGPVSEYGRAKLAGEKNIAEVMSGGYAILRTAWLYGCHGKNFLKTMLRLALADSEKHYKVVADQFGSPTWSMTLARQIKEVVKVRAKGVFHATSEGYCSWYDLACEFLELMQVPHSMQPCTTDEYPTPAVRPENSILENRSLKEAGINVFNDWRDELRAYVSECGESVLNEVKELA
ncbi:dTDP-4-dehydrorhamnose reductase [Verrucomicrobiota bacterium]